MDINAISALEIRATSCLPSVALFTDRQLAELAQHSQDFGILGHLLGELLVRTWLYDAGETKIETKIEELAAKLEMTGFVTQFRATVRPLRKQPWPINDDIVCKAFAVEKELTPAQEQFWSFIKRRVCAFIGCDGIIPTAIIKNKKIIGTVAIPFSIQWDRDKGKILDSKNNPIDGWISESQELCKTLGRHFGVRLGCEFGNYAVFRNGESLTSGGSFALPILFGATRAKDKSVHPLDVICTGEVLNNELREIGGRDEKHQLAKDMGAKLFAAPGIGRPWFLSPGLNIKQAVVAILKECGLAEAEIADHIDDVFVEQESGPFTRAIQELTAHFVGRDQQIDQVFDWIEASATSGAKRIMWIGGKAGCGKSAFMAGLMQSPKSAGLVSVPYFFDPKWMPKNRWQDDFFKYAADCIALEYQVDLSQVRFEKPEDQFRFALASLPGSELPRLLFLLDGVDEVEGSLDGIALVATEFSRCIWIFAGQETDTTEILRNIPSIKHFPLGGLKWEAMVQMINDAARNMPAQLVTAIVEKADGFPQYTKLMLDEWEKRGSALDPTKLPQGLSESYKDIIERLRKGGDFTQQWRSDIIHVLALLATARQRTPLTAASIAAMLTRYVRPYSPKEIGEALDVCRPILRSLIPDADKEEREWTFSHNGFRQYILESQSTLSMRNQAQKAWADACREWDSQDLEDGLRAYALRFLVEELTEAGENAAVVELANQQRFLDAQSFRLGPRVALETMAYAINLALTEGNLADAAALTLARASRAEHTYSESPFAAMRERNNRWALEVIEHIENQADRTLWHLAFAAWHTNGNRPHLAAQVLDEAIPRDALCEKLVGGASMCAALLMSLLENVPTRRFQWERFLSRLDDTSKREIIPLLMNKARPSMQLIRKMVHSISQLDLRSNARKDVIREIAVSNPNEAERQLANFEREFDRAFGAIEVVAAFARRRAWPQVKRVMAAHIPREALRQRAKALSYIAVELNRAGLRVDSRSAFLDGLDAISALASKPDQQAKTYAEFGLVQAEAGFVSQADRAFQSAMEVAAKLKASHIFRAKCFAALLNNFALATEYSQKLLPFVNRAASQAMQELERSDDHEVDPTRLRLVRCLGRNGHFELALLVLNSMQDTSLRTEATARLCSYYIRSGRPAPQELIKRVEKRSGFDSKILLHSLIAVEKVKEDRTAALVEVVKNLRHPTTQWRTQCWGPARVLSEAGVVLAQHKDSRAPRLLKAATRKLDRIPQYERGRYFVDLAIRSAECGCDENAREMFLLARKCIPNTKDEKSQVDLWVEIESAERRCHLQPEADSKPISTVFEHVCAIGNEKDTLAHKLVLQSELVAPMAEAGFLKELEEICLFAVARLENGRFLLKPEKRSELAGAFAGKLSKSALNVNGFREWTARFVEVCRTIQTEHQVPMPAGSIRAEALMKVADGEFTEAIAAAQRIGVGETRSIVFRDLAIRAVREGDCSQALHLATRITHGRSQHLPDIGREIVVRGVQTDAPYLHRLVVICSEYSDAAYRITSSLIRFHKPRPDVVVAVLRACALSNGIDFSEPSNANQ